MEKEKFLQELKFCSAERCPYREYTGTFAGFFCSLNNKRVDFHGGIGVEGAAGAHAGQILIVTLAANHGGIVSA